MSLLYPSRRHGTQTLLKALTQPCSSAAMTSPAPGCTSLPETILGPADAYTHRRWSHYAASTSYTSLPGRFHPSQARAFSTGPSENDTPSGGSGSRGVHAPPPPPPSLASPRFPRRPIIKETVDGEDPSPPPPGAALKRVAHTLDHLNLEPELPPWQAVSSERLSRELFEYRNDLASAKKSVTAARKSSNKPSLPFIGEAVSSIVDAEREALASPYRNLYDSSNNNSGGRGGGSGNKKLNTLSTTSPVHNVSARSLNKRLGFAQLRAVLDMVPGQDGQRSGTSSQLYDQMWSDASNKSTSIAALPSKIEREREETQREQQQKQQGTPVVKPLGGDEAQSILASKANEVIGVLTAVEFLLPLAPWQRRVVSRAVVESMHTESDDEGDTFSRTTSNTLKTSAVPKSTIATSTTNNRISALSARTAVSFLLTDCGLTHRQAAHAIAEHPWLLGIENIRTRCSGFLESLQLLNMDATAIAVVVAAHPLALLMDADKDIIPLLEYLNGLGFVEEDAAELIRAAPKLLLDPIAKQRLAGCVAFWVGQGMSRPALRSLLTAAPEVTSMSLRLLQLKLEWLMEHAGFGIEDYALVPATVQLPLAAHVAPRLAFARHRGFTVNPPSKEKEEEKDTSFFASFTTSSAKDSLKIESLLSSSEFDFLRSVGNATDAEFRAFEAAWRDSDLKTWFKTRLSTISSVTQYEGMEWLADEEIAPLREMHDHHVALREIAWEQQHDREKEWDAVWSDWKRAQTRRDQIETWTKRMKKRREDEALRRATVEMTMLAESQGLRRPGMCLKSPYCNRKVNHPGTCNQKLALKMNLDDYIPVVDDDIDVDHLNSAALDPFSATNFDANEFLNSSIGGLGPGGIRGHTVHEVATLSEVDAGLYLFGEIKSDIPVEEDEDNNGHHLLSLDSTSINSTTSGNSTTSTTLPIIIGDDESIIDDLSTASSSLSAPLGATASGPVSSEGYLVLGDGPTITKEEIESQDIDQVLECFAGLEALLERAPHGVLSHRTVNAWVDRQGYSRAVSTAAKGVLAATGTARVVVEPNFQYHKVVPKAWQLLHRSSSGSGQEKELQPRLTRSAANIAMLSNLIYEMIDNLPGRMILRKDLRSWSELQWKGSSKLQLRAVVAGLSEQGLVVQRRQKGISSGPMEVSQVDLKRYLLGLSHQYSGESLRSHHSGEENNDSGNFSSAGGVSGSGNNTVFSATSPTFTTSPTTSQDNVNSNATTITTAASVFESYQARSALLRRVRFTDDDWTRFENLAHDQVRNCANGMLELLRSMPEMSVSHRVLASWAAQQGYDKETLTAAKAVMFCEGTASIFIEPKESNSSSNGSSGNGSFMPQKMWVATEQASSLIAETTTTVHRQQTVPPGLLQEMLETVREARGGFMSKGELRSWVKIHMGSEWQGVGALNTAIATLLESGCIVQLAALPLLDGKKKSKVLVAIDLSQYLDDGDGIESGSSSGSDIE